MGEQQRPVKLDILKILELLPHRYPFVMVDRVTDIVAGSTIQGIKNVTINEPFFQGHFPGQPVMPGVMILEGMAQVGGVLGYHSLPEMIGQKLLYFAGINHARFRKPVVPGDQLIYDLTLLKMKRGVMVMDGKAHVDGQRVAEAELMASFG
ncbi:MAG: 3-hydroxyacyl-ACP dehydratase FabZ [Desulfopila sp.]